MSFLCRETTSLLQQEPIYNMSCQVDKVAVFFFRFFLKMYPESQQSGSSMCPKEVTYCYVRQLRKESVELVLF